MVNTISDILLKLLFTWNYIQAYVKGFNEAIKNVTTDTIL
jgi:hypothetical protein